MLFSKELSPPIKEKKFLAKLWLKISNKKQYKQYKKELNDSRTVQAFISRHNDLREVVKKNIKTIESISAQGKPLNFLHSGNAGDIIYSLPVLKKIYETSGIKQNIFLQLDQPLIMPEHYHHPLGGTMLNSHMANMLIPLIMAQSYINLCAVYSNEKIHINLDSFRSDVIPMNRTNIARWYTYITGVQGDLFKKWIITPPDVAFKDTIVLARSSRYQNVLIDYSFLNQYPNICFVGVPDEFEAMKKKVTHMTYHEVDNFFELSSLIAGCKFFIGNQSFPFSLAEALKVPRVLEGCFDVTNVIPEGENAHDYFFQEHFEKIVKNFHLGG